MEARLQTDYRERHAPDWPAAVVAGLAAGAILMVLDLLWSIVVPRGNPWATSHMIAAMWMGPDTLQAPGFKIGVVAAALATHYVLGVVFAMILVAITTALRLDARPGTALLAGAVFGMVIYVLNFFALVQVFPWFADLRGWPTVVAHLVFGVSAALIYRALERRSADRGDRG